MKDIYAYSVQDFEDYLGNLNMKNLERNNFMRGSIKSVSILLMQ